MSVNTTYEPITFTVDQAFLDDRINRVNLTWQYEPRVSGLKVTAGPDDLEVLSTCYLYDDPSNSIVFSLDALFALGVEVTIERVTPITQTESFEAGRFIIEDEIEMALDKLVFIAQEIKADDS